MSGKKRSELWMEEYHRATKRAVSLSEGAEKKTTFGGLFAMAHEICQLQRIACLLIAQTLKEEEE